MRRRRPRRRWTPGCGRSPFLAVGIYISGDSRGCRSQPNLTPKWVATQLRKGWRLLPITLGPQASCHPSFPRYDDDDVDQPEARHEQRYPAARRQARSGGRERGRGRAGISASSRGSTLWYDLEGFDLTTPALPRVGARASSPRGPRKLHALDYVSGVYSSAGSGIKMLDDARVNRPDQVTLPDRIWIARWDGKANTRTDYIRDDGWRPGGRMKQYQGGHNETWGGVTINIDRNWLDLGRGSVAAPVTHCKGVDVDHPTYQVLAEGTHRDRAGQGAAVPAQGAGRSTAARLNGTYNDEDGRRRQRVAERPRLRRQRRPGAACTG